MDSEPQSKLQLKFWHADVVIFKNLTDQNFRNVARNSKYLSAAENKRIYLFLHKQFVGLSGSKKKKLKGEYLITFASAKFLKIPKICKNVFRNAVS